MSLMVICVFALSLYELVMLSGRELKRTVPGIKKRRPYWSSIFGARNRTSSIIRYFTLLADIVCINPFRNKPDMTTMTNNSSKI